MADDSVLLSQFNREPGARAGQDAFTALVDRYLNLVYSAAFRMVRSPQLAEEVSQSVFTQLARNSAALKRGTVLPAWLYQVTHHAAVDVVRREARRQSREQIACEMSQLMNDTAADWAQIEPHLDQAMQSLEQSDRTAILLRYFENRSLREVGEALGSSEDAAQKRVSRALDRLRDYFVKNKIAAPAAGLAGVISAHAVQAAPVGLSAVVASSSLVTAAASISTATSFTTAKIIVMTTLQKIAVGVVLTGAAVALVFQHRQLSRLRAENEGLAQSQAREAALTQQVKQLEQERDQASNALALLKGENATLAKRPNEVAKLRNEVGKLRDRNTQLGATTPISKITATPEARQLLRDQQKAGMGMIYKGFADQMKLTSDQTEKLNNLLADHIMQNVDQVIGALRDKTPPAQFGQMLAGENSTLEQNVQDLLGADGLAKYQDYTKNLLANLTTAQFQDSLTGTDDEKKAKADQLRAAIEQQSQSALAAAGLPADFQTVPMLNFVNIASEQEADQNLKLLGGIYQNVIANAGSYLSPGEITKLQTFTGKAVSNNTAALSMNRILMTPISSQQ